MRRGLPPAGAEAAPAARVPGLSGAAAGPAEGPPRPRTAEGTLGGRRECQSPSRTAAREKPTSSQNAL